MAQRRRKGRQDFVMNQIVACPTSRKVGRAVSPAVRGEIIREMKRKALPEFKSEDDERKFWATADSTEYVDWSLGKRRKFVHLKPSLKRSQPRDKE